MKQKSLNNQENKHIFDIVLSLPQYIGSTIAIAIFIGVTNLFVIFLYSEVIYSFVLFQ